MGTCENEFKCELCWAVYRHRASLQRHNKNSHGLIVEKIFKCDFCDAQFNNVTSVKRHECKAHNIVLTRCMNEKKFKCEFCDAKYTRKEILKKHEIKVHNKPHNVKTRRTVNCFECPFETVKKSEMIKHYVEMHSIKIVTRHLTFTNYEEFLNWKANMELDSRQKFVKPRGCQTRAGNMKHLYFSCHRSGNFVSKSEGKRHPRVQGSKKMNALCPAHIKVMQLEDGVCLVDFIETHLHPKYKLDHLFLSPTEHEDIILKIANAKSYDIVLDEIRELVSTTALVRKVQHQSKTELNAENAFNHCNNGIEHKNDIVGVEYWVQEIIEKNCDCILYYKPQGKIDVMEPNFNSDDTVLIIMTKQQADILQKFGIEKVSVDGTDIVKNEGLNLFTLMTINEVNCGFPAAFLISNRANESVFSLFFNYIKKQIGVLNTKVFLSSIGGAYNAWLDLMGVPGKHFFCTWHIDKEWRRNIKDKIKVFSKQVIVYKCLQVLLMERNKKTFIRLLFDFMLSLEADQELHLFSTYFSNNFFKTKRFWAYCFRKKFGLNTIMHMERIHHTLQSIFLYGKEVKRLNKALFALMIYVEFRSFDSLSLIKTGEVSEKKRNLGSISSAIPSDTEGEILNVEISEHNDEYTALLHRNATTTEKFLALLEDIKSPEGYDILDEMLTLAKERINALHCHNTFIQEEDRNI